jgi:hypothetical protein
VPTDPPSGPYYLDAIFSRVRLFAQLIESGKGWATRAEATQNRAWRLTFLREARAAEWRARDTLQSIEQRVAALGPEEALPPPLDTIHENLETMRADLLARSEAVARLEAREVESPAIGKA